jgi:di/tricarboxylate transporter
MTLHAFERGIADSDAQVIGLVRNEVRITAPHPGRRIRAEDILVLQADVDALTKALSVFGIKLEEQVVVAPDVDVPANPAAQAEKPGAGEAAASDDDDDPKRERNEDIVLRELAVLPGSTIVAQSAKDLKLRTRYGINLLAVSRGGRAPTARLRTLKLKSGDLLLVQGAPDAVSAFMNDTGCVPLGERKLRIPDKRKAITAGAIMLGTIGIVALGLLPVAPAFALGVLASMVLRTVPLRQIYTSIDWSVVVLLAALLPVADAMQSTGAADQLARFLVDTIARGNPVVALAVVLITTMFLSDVMNNVATAAVLCPIALGISATLGVSPDSFLMAVAIGASCAFLTPIGHQNNTLILGPGGFRFGDYWKLGLPLEVLVVAISMPLLLIVWPL